MISALAARRAAAASSSTPATPEPVIQQKRKDPPPSASPRPSGESSAPTSAKRQKRVGASAAPKSGPSSQPKPPYTSAQARSSQSSAVTGPSGSQNADNHGPRSFSPSRMLDDSSDDDAQAPKPSTLRLSPLDDDLMDVALSTFVPVLDQNVFPIHGAVDKLRLEAPSCLFVMRPGETMSLVGGATLRLLQGTVNLDGVTLKPSKVAHRIFAPISNALPCIRALDVNEPATKIPAAFRQYAQLDFVVFILSELHTGVSGLSDVCRRFDDIFAPRRDPCAPLPIQGIFLVERASRRLQPFILPRSWELVLDRLEQSTTNSVSDTAMPSASVILIKGPKRSGKSTLARTLLNRLVTRYRRVAFLECDVGQSEFTPAGMVSLHVLDTPAFGPPFTHVAKKPIVAHWTGAATARTDPAHYLACVAACVQTYLVDIQHSFEDDEVQGEEDDRIADVVPLVVNTHGWNKGLGADLTLKIQEMVSATDIVDFEPEPTDPASSTVRLHTVSPVDSSLNANYTASDFRVLNIMSYFYGTGDGRWDTSLPLCAVPPWEVGPEALDAVVLACPGGEDVPSFELATALNGGIVALVSAEPGALDIPDTESSTNAPPLLPYKQATASPNPLLSRCIGLGLVRYASADSIHLLTPVSPADLAQCRVLVKGELELPVVGWLDHHAVDGRIAGIPRDGVPYLQWDAGDGVGATRRKVRRNLMRWGQRAA